MASRNFSIIAIESAILHFRADVENPLSLAAVVVTGVYQREVAEVERLDNDFVQRAKLAEKLLGTEHGVQVGAARQLPDYPVVSHYDHLTRSTITGASFAPVLIRRARTVRQDLHQSVPVGMVPEEITLN